jgi:hypothetical protein
MGVPTNARKLGSKDISTFLNVTSFPNQPHITNFARVQKKKQKSLTFSERYAVDIALTEGDHGIVRADAFKDGIKHALNLVLRPHKNIPAPNEWATLSRDRKHEILVRWRDHAREQQELLRKEKKRFETTAATTGTKENPLDLIKSIDAYSK